MATSYFMECLEAVRDAIKDMDLTGLEDYRVRVRRLPHDGEHYFPGVTIHPVPEVYSQGTNMRESLGYGCAVTMVVNNDNDQDYLLDRLLLWRETIRRTLVEDATISGVTGTIYRVGVEHGHVIDWNDLFDKNVDVSSMTVRCWLLETRL